MSSCGSSRSPATARIRRSCARRPTGSRALIGGRTRHGGARQPDGRRADPGVARRRADRDRLRPLRRPVAGPRSSCGRARRSSRPPRRPRLRPRRATTRATSTPLLRAALDLAEAGELGVNVRVLADGEEEVGGHSVIDHLADVDGKFAAAVIFDSGMVDTDQPAITTGLRGLAGAQVRLMSGARELHSGLYGGAAANAVHDLHTVLRRWSSLPAGFSRAGIAPVSAPGAGRLGDAAPGRRGAAERGGVRRPTTGRRRRVLRAHLVAPGVHRPLGRRRRPAAPQDSASSPRRGHRSRCASPRARMRPRCPRCWSRCCATPARPCRARARACGRPASRPWMPRAPRAPGRASTHRAGDRHPRR